MGAQLEDRKAAGDMEGGRRELWVLGVGGARCLVGLMLINFLSSSGFVRCVSYW